MNIITSNQSFSTVITQVTQPTDDAILYNQFGLSLRWDATAKWFKWLVSTEASKINYNTGYLRCVSEMVASLNEYSAPMRIRAQASGNSIWLNSDPTVAPVSVLDVYAFAQIQGKIKFLTPTLAADCDVWFRISVDINSSTGNAADCTADSFITSRVQFMKW